MFRIHRKRAWMKWLRAFNAVVILSMTFQPVGPALILAQSAGETPEEVEVVAEEPEEEPAEEVKEPEEAPEEEDAVTEESEAPEEVIEEALEEAATESEEATEEPETGTVSEEGAVGEVPADDATVIEEPAASDTPAEEAADDPNIPNEPTVEAEGPAFDEREAVGEEEANEEAAALAEWLAEAEDGGYEIMSVVEGETYEYGDDGFSITFTQIDGDVADAYRVIGIKEVTLSDEQREALGALSDTAYDVISPMGSGAFEYELTLPTPEDVDGDSVAVAYVENEDDLDDPKKMETVDVDDVSVDTDKKEVKVKDLDHFTVYYLFESNVPVEKVTLCHATASGSNPYTTNTVNINSIGSCQNVGNGSNGHGDHEHDIIPPYQYDTCTYNGKNWDTGQAIWNNGCEIPSGTQVTCGDGVVNQTSEECDGEAGVDEGENFCTSSCTLVPIYDGEHTCQTGTLEKKVGEYEVDSEDKDGIEVSLYADTDYLFRVSGTFTSSSGGHVSDAGYTTQDNWSSLTDHGLNGVRNDYAAHALLGDMGTDTVGVIDWGEYDPDHEYAKAYSTDDAVTAQFVIGDRYGDWFDANWQNQGGMGDNEGSLALDVYECQALPAPVQTGYNENDGDPYATPRDPNELACMGDFTLINGVSVHWTEVGVDGETVKYERQYAVGNGPWTGSEIYSDPYTNYRTFGGGSGTPGEYSSRVRAFIDENDNNHVDDGEIVSEWSNTCAITYRVIDTLPEAEPECEDGKEYAKITTGYTGDIWFGDHYAQKNVWFELPSDASTSIGDEGAVLTYDGDDLTVTLLAREDDARQDFVASIEFHGQEVSALVPETSGQYKLETESNCGSHCHIDRFEMDGARKVDIDFAVDVAHDRGVIKLEEAPVLCPIEACTLDFAVNNGADLTEIDLSDGSQIPVDTLAFGSSAADAQPGTGDVYYIERYGNRLAHYDISERENVVIGSTGISGVVDKLAFESTGALYAMTSGGALYQVDTTTAVSTHQGTSEMGEHEDGGDLVFGDGGDLYAIVKGGKVFEIDPETAHADLLGDTNIEATGMTFKDGIFYATDNAKRLYTFGKYSMDTPSLVGWTEAINDLARCPVEVTKNDVKICKRDPAGAPLPGWDIQLLGEHVEDVTVPTDGSTTVSTSDLPTGDYALVASGTYEYRGNSGLLSDPNFSQRLDGDQTAHFKPGTTFPYWNWANVNDFKSVWEGFLGVMVDGTATNWSDYLASDNRYALGYSDHTGSFDFDIYDNNYGDNVGTMNVAVYHGYAGTTGDDGCVIFEDVPYGDYKIAETLRVGWENVDGLGEVSVDSDDETFSVINRQLPGTIEVTKVALDRHGNEITDATTEFTIRINGKDKTVKDGETVVYDNLLPGVYTVEEVSVPGAYELISIETDEIPVTDGTQVILDPNETVSVTVTNHEAPYCGDGVMDEDFGEQCDGSDGVTAGENFCTPTCQLVPIYDGAHTCPTDKPFEKFIGSYEIGSKDADGEEVSLTGGIPYLFRAGGTYEYANNSARQADAAYATTNNWSSVRGDIGIWGTNRGVTSVLADLGLGVGVVEWDDDSSFDADHTYEKQFTPIDDMDARFLISDWYGDWYGNYCKDQSCMGDNDGSITLDVYECSAPVTVSATKIVCDSEEDLPNWHGGPNMTATTATEYVTAHEGCHLVPDWLFEWGNNSVSNPGDDVVGPAGNGWKTFGPTDGSGVAEVDIYDFSENRIKLREVLQDGYLPFSYLANGSTNDDDVTAEFYCGTDVANYDNEEWLNNPTRGETYYCVAWNVELGSIHGQKWNDEDGDGEKDGEENYMDGWTIFLDEDGDKVLDEGETSTETSSDPDHFGWYWFEDLLPGEYSVCEVIKDGWEQTYPGTSYEPACHTVTVPDENPNGYKMMENHVEDPTPTYDFGNEELGICSIRKTNDAIGPKKPNETIGFTIEVTASEGRVKGVTTTDLPAEVTKYVGGSWKAVSSLRGDLSGLGLGLTKVYASPGVWDLGDMEDGEVVTLTYDATVLEGTDAGDYPDLAYARGTGRDGALYALATLDGDITDDRFVGTRVAVADTTEPEPVRVSTDFEEEEEEVVEERVLGATLPDTGAPTFWVVLAATLFGLGAMGLAFGAVARKRSVAGAGRTGKGAFPFVFSLVLVLGLFFGATSASAQVADLFVRMEEPKADIGGGFTLDFVVLAADETDGIAAECQVKKPGETEFSTFGTVDLDNDKDLGDSGQCGVGAAEMPDDGTYVFRVKGTAPTADDAYGAEYSVAYDTTFPGRPKYIERDKETDCRNEITFRTANDGQTAYVEVYRENDERYIANEDTRILTLAIGPDTKYSFDDHLPDPLCDKENYYAVRAFDAAGNPSPIREEEVTEEVEVTVYEDIVAVTGGVTLTPGAEEGAGTGAEGGEVEGVEGEGGEVAGEEASVEEEGVVEGVSTTAERYGWLLWILLAIVVGYAAYWRFVGRKAEESSR